MPNCLMVTIKWYLQILLVEYENFIDVAPDGMVKVDGKPKKV